MSFTHTQTLVPTPTPTTTSSNATATTTTTTTNATTSTATPTVDPLEQAGKIIDDRLGRDENWRVTGDSIRGTTSADYVLPQNSAWSPFQKSRSVLLPDRLFEEHDLSKAHVGMGILPEIERCWVTVDHRLFLWDWSDNSLMETYEELTETIVGVGIVRPRPGVFVDSISHLLVLSTPSEVHLVGLDYSLPPSSPPTKKQITFYITGLSVPTDNISLTTIIGTHSGRIFLSSIPDQPPNRPDIYGNGHLYEISYQSTESWFVKKCTLHNLTTNSWWGGFERNLLFGSKLLGGGGLERSQWVVDLKVDDERGLLYTLLRGGTIEMYQLPPTTSTSAGGVLSHSTALIPSTTTTAATTMATKRDFSGPAQKVAKVTDLARQSAAFCPSPMLNPRSIKIVGMEVISLKEGGNNKIGLVAITGTGVRLYFTHQRRGYYNSSSQPSFLELCHVRPPPPPIPLPNPAPPLPSSSSSYYPSATPAPPPPTSFSIPLNDIRQAKYAKGGLFIASNHINNDVDLLFFATPDVALAARNNADLAHQASHQHHSNLTTMTTGNTGGGGGGLGGTQRSPYFSEVAGSFEISGSTWDIAEITPASFSTSTLGGGLSTLNELGMQSINPRREWVVLTNTGVNVVVRQRPVDTLVEVLESAGMGNNGNGNGNGNGGHGEIGVFYDNYGRDQFCSMLLSIAAGNSRLSGTSAIDSTVSGNHANNLSGVSRPTTSAVADQAKALFFEGGGGPVSIDIGGGFGGAQGGATAGSRIIFSGRHEGFACYFARLIKPIWKERITVVTATGQVSNLSEGVLSSVQRDLISLRTFIEQEQQLFTLLPEGGRASHQAQAYKTEQDSLNSLRLLLIQSVEAISFVLLLIDYKITDIVNSCPKDLQTTLLGMNFQGLLTTMEGRKCARSLVNAVINQQIGKQLSVDVISDTLQQRCGSFCSADDVLMYKAIEAVRRAKDTPSAAERTESLRESLRLFTKATKHLTLERLQEVCTEYNSMHYPQGVIDLALSCAHDWDPTGRGTAYWADGCPAHDDRKGQYESRTKCHSLAFESLAACDDLLNKARQGSTGSLSPEEADGLRVNAYNKALAVTDEFFHFALYDWFLSRGMTDQLLECRTSYLESYLSRDPTLEKTDLLWQYYVRTSKFISAASVLAQLAETHSLPLSIHKRVEYLSLSVSNAKSQFPSSHSSNNPQIDTVSFLTDVEEKLEVAQVQVEIYRAIDDSEFNGEDGGVQQKEFWLNKVEEKLWNISELYSEFAEPLELLEIILLIFHVSDHQAPALVQSTWEAILSRANEVGKENSLPGGSTVRAKVVELGRRFFTSDVSFPVPVLVEMLEGYSLENRTTIQLPPGWVPLALREAGTPWEDIWSAMDELMGAKVPPWHLPSSTSFLASDICAMLQSWLGESANTSRTHGVTVQFPAGQVESSLGKYMMSLGGGAGAEEVVGKLRELQREIRRRY